MIALELTNIKDFMNKLLKTETFDHFLLQEAVLSSAASYVIDGHITNGFYSESELEELGLTGLKMLPFSSLRGNCFDLIKGTHTPTAFRFVLHLLPEHVAAILQKGNTSVTADQVKAFVLNIKYDGSTLTLVTGTAFHSFLMDKTPDQLWDVAIRQFLSKKEIGYEEL